MLTSLYSALSEVVGNPLPYNNVYEMRDRLCVLVRYDVTEPTSVEIALAGLKILAGQTAAAKMTDTPLRKPIFNFYQTDPISRA